MSRARPDAATGGTALFVRRPILAFVLSAMVVIAGLASLFGVEVRELPDVDRPVITVTTDFGGAAPETIDREITAAVEGAMSRVAGVKSISSSSRFGRSRVTAEFADTVDLDAAASDARDAVARIVNSLPDDADVPEIVKADANADPVMRISVTSSIRSPEELTTLVTDLVEDRLISVPGVADLQTNGARQREFRVDLNALQMASRGLTLAEVRSALANAAFDSPAGELSSQNQSITVRTTASLATPEEFEALVLRENIRLGDVATVTLGPDPGDSVLRANGEAGIGLSVVRQAQSNTLQISDGIRTAVAEVAKFLPPDVKIFVTSDEATFIRGAIDEVVKALTQAVVIVIVVIFLFLRDWRATLVPALAIPVSLIGTLAAVYLVGFSINILTLLALVLATGLVVDDAIVVLENIVRRRSEGMGPRAAAVLGTQEVFFAVIATTVTLAAVFVPLSFLPGQAGGLFSEFGFTLAIAVCLSSVVALTLCPVVASRILTRETAQDAQAGVMGRIGSTLQDVYRRSLRLALDAPLIVVTVAGLFAAAAWITLGSVPRELTPQEDRAVALASVSAPQGVSLDYTAAKMREIEGLLEPLRASGEVRNLFLISGTGGQGNRGFMVLTLAPWGERVRSQAEIVDEVNGLLRRVVGVQAFAIQPNSLGIRGAGRGLQFAVLGSDYDRLADEAGMLITAMEADPMFDQVTLNYETTQPQLFVAVDRARASDLGIAIEGLGEALQGMLDGRTVTQAFVGDESFDVKMVSTGTPVNDPSDLENVFVRTSSGAMVPISTIVTLEERAVAPELSREGQQRAVSVTATLQPGVALGDALARAEALAAEVLPSGGRIVPLAEAATLAETSRGIFVTFGFALLIVFLVLAAQFESFVSAVIVMATVPLGLACAVFALVLTGTSLNVYSQIGLVMLVGIMAKNGILIVEFANQLRDQGKSVRDAIEQGALIRVRPVVMTMIATVMGGVPLILSVGAGSEARAALGWVIVGGLGLSTLVTLFLTPVAYLLLAGLSKSRGDEEARLVAELNSVVSGR